MKYQATHTFIIRRETAAIDGLGQRMVKFTAGDIIELTEQEYEANSTFVTPVTTETDSATTPPTDLGLAVPSTVDNLIDRLQRQDQAVKAEIKRTTKAKAKVSLGA